jgi:hypothetical protein
MQSVVVGDDVPVSDQGRADQGVGLVLGAGVASVGDDRAGTGSGRIVGGDTDGVVDQFRFGVQHLLIGVELGKPGGDRLVRSERRVEFGVGGVYAGVDGSIIVLVSTPARR